MAIAIIWIVLYHSNLSLPIGINVIQVFGYGGVDIFFFCSGIGAWYSVNKYKGEYCKYVKHSLLKIMPAYYIILLVWTIFLARVETISLKEIIGNVTCTGWLLGMDNQFNWYMTAIVAFYFVAPFFVGLAKKYDSLKIQIFFVLFFSFLGIFFVKSNLLMMISRVPISYLGILLAKRIERNEIVVSSKLFICTVGVSACLLGLMLFFMLFNNEILWDFGVWWYPMIIIAPTICLAISTICEAIQCNKVPIVTILDKLGKKTYIVYLAHVTEFFVVKWLITNGIVMQNNILWGWCFLVLIPICIVLDKINLFLLSSLKVLPKEKIK